MHPSTTAHWELVSGAAMCAADTHGPVIGDIPEVVLQALLDGLG
ncbi:hypothetical protein [Janthinobacterium agaricidamnosum]|uniref:Uncharacterized protein n=1 Tax=Janthinobacterium agaricidamnosum NBRC 102515 = DSM 9628 TaxID=1349767 RepID=W0V952_9BURK|nr:hypothetical protein [Janthinobacterium agaricidamnosum]CDG85359.1 hypothetical protein GJA_4755 [Janthinobacterium agaricidamnosum NBRC 102515 = DSM 9628]